MCKTCDIYEIAYTGKKTNLIFEVHSQLWGVKQLDHPNFAIRSIMAHHTALLKMQPGGKINMPASALSTGTPVPNPGAKPEVSSFAFSARPVFLTLEEGVACTPAWSPGSRCCRCMSALIHRRLPPTCNFSSSPHPPHPLRRGDRQMPFRRSGP